MLRIHAANVPRHGVCTRGPSEGANAYAVKRLANDIGMLAHPEIILKSDGEPAIIALIQAVQRERHERIVMEESPVHDSTANGGIENAIQQVQGQIRAIKGG